MVFSNKFRNCKWCFVKIISLEDNERLIYKAGINNHLNIAVNLTNNKTWFNLQLVLKANIEICGVSWYGLHLLSNDIWMFHLKIFNITWHHELNVFICCKFISIIFDLSHLLLLPYLMSKWNNAQQKYCQPPKPIKAQTTCLKVSQCSINLQVKFFCKGDIIEQLI